MPEPPKTMVLGDSSSLASSSGSHPRSNLSNSGSNGGLTDIGGSGCNTTDKTNNSDHQGAHTLKYKKKSIIDNSLQKKPKKEGKVSKKTSFKLNNGLVRHSDPFSNN